jgi:hypothetical protein
MGPEKKFELKGHKWEQYRDTRYNDGLRGY